MINSKIILIILLFFLFFSNRIFSANLTVLDSTFNNCEDDLLLINKIPFGIDYKTVKKSIPNLSNLRKEGFHGNLYEAKAEIFILNHKGKIEFNFKSIDSLNILSSYYYFIDSLNRNTADSLYQLLKEFYNKQYGNSTEEKQDDPAGFYNITSFWKTKEFSVVLTNNVYFDYCLLGWGFQKPRK